MEIISDFPVDIDENRVVSMMHCGQEQLDNMRELVKKEIEACLPVLHPRIAIERVKIKKVEDQKVILENGIAFEGELTAQKLGTCQYVAACACTVGSEIDDYIDAKFKKGDYLAGYTADSIAVSALEYLDKKLWNILVDRINGTSFGITSRLSPGDSGWELSGQSGLFACLGNTGEIGVTLNDSCMMLPLKSASAVYGFGENIGITRTSHVCSECPVKSCSYRFPDEHTIFVDNGALKSKIQVRNGDNLLFILQKSGLIGHFPCAGNGICGKCGVRILSGIPEPTSEDRSHFTSAELENGYRLSCCVKVCSEMELFFLPPASDPGYEIMTDGIRRDFSIDSPVKKRHLVFDQKCTKDSGSDLERVSDGMEIKGLTAGIGMLRNMSNKMRKADFDFTATAFNQSLIGIEKGDTRRKQFGIAADIGTTTLVCYLIDLQSGNIVDIEAQANSQSIHGADVISRIHFTAENRKGTETLRNLIVGQINKIIDSLCVRNGIDKRHLYNLAITGNTIMIHFFMGLPTKNIAVSPFSPVTVAATDFKAVELGIRIDGVVSIMPGIAGYVGSDITADILACSMMESEEYSLLIDLGTNGEMALGNSHGVTTCAVAAGPAFEGGHIKFGTGGIRGAICSVDFGRENICRTIGGGTACGLCGSGVLDTAAQLLKYGILDKAGRLADVDSIKNTGLRERLSEDGEVRQFMLEENSTLGRAIVFTQKDIREVQLAKAAVSAGIRVLLKQAGIKVREIKKVYIAGGFGNFMNMESALRIGLIPRQFKGKTISVGNTAGVGAKLYLLSNACREKAMWIAEHAGYLELSDTPDFQEFFINSMSFE